MNIKSFYIILLICFFSQVGLAQESSTNAGTASVLLLKFGPNPRVTGLSEAFTGLADDENALYYNPAGLPYINSGIVTLNHSQWFEDIRIENITTAHYISKKFGVAAGLTHMWMPGIEGMDNFGQPSGSIDISSSIVNVGFAYKILPSFSLGIGVKYFQDKLGSYIANGVGLDAGLLFKTFVSGLSAGLAVQNFGSEVKYDTEKQKIPTTFRGGMVYKLYSPEIQFVLDVVKSIDIDYNVNFGIEYVFQNQFTLRIGNKFTENETLTPSFSAGFNVKQKYYLDYTFVNYTDLGSTHRLGFSYHFNSRSSTPKAYSYSNYSKPVNLVPPANLRVIITDDKLRISWDRVEGVQYNVYAKHSSKEKWMKLNKSVLYNNSMEFKTPTAKGIYYFKVSSYYGGKESKHSKEANINVN